VQPESGRAFTPRTVEILSLHWPERSVLTIGGGQKRLIQQLEAFPSAVYVTIGRWRTLFANPPSAMTPRSTLPAFAPKVILRSYRRVDWLPCMAQN